MTAGNRGNCHKYRGDIADQAEIRTGLVCNARTWPHGPGIALAITDFACDAPATERLAQCRLQVRRVIKWLARAINNQHLNSAASQNASTQLNRTCGFRDVGSAFAAARQKHDPTAWEIPVGRQVKQRIADAGNMTAQGLFAAPVFRSHRVAGRIAFPQTQEPCGRIIGVVAKSEPDRGHTRNANKRDKR